MRSEDTVVQEQVARGAGNEGCQLLQEFDRLEEEVRGAIAPGRLELDEDAPVGAETQAVLGERGAEEITTELLEASAIVGGHPDVGVEVEAIALGLARAAGGEVTEVRLVAEAADAGAGAGAEGNATMEGGADEAGEDGRSLGLAAAYYIGLAAGGAIVLGSLVLFGATTLHRRAAPSDAAADEPGQ
jgi:hypothetical protein